MKKINKDGCEIKRCTKCKIRTKWVLKTGERQSYCKECWHEYERQRYVYRELKLTKCRCGKEFMPQKYNPNQKYCSQKCVLRVCSKRWKSEHKRQYEEKISNWQKEHPESTSNWERKHPWHVKSWFSKNTELRGRVLNQWKSLYNPPLLIPPKFTKQ